jgi:hypothetical protein
MNKTQKLILELSEGMTKEELDVFRGEVQRIVAQVKSEYPPKKSGKEHKEDRNSKS